MMATGQRFELNLDSDIEARASPAAAPPLSFGFVKDITERDPAAVEAPTPPRLTSVGTGFPEHKKRTRTSRFKAKQEGATAKVSPARSSQAQQSTSSWQPTSTVASVEEQSRQQAKLDSEQAFNGLSREEVEEQRRELLAGDVPGVTPSLIERLLKRANINEDLSDPLEPPAQPEKRWTHKAETELERGQSTGRSEEELPRIQISPATAQEPLLRKPQPPPQLHDSNAAPARPPDDLRPATSKEPLPPRPPPPSTHFPAPAQRPDLDPSSPTFLSDLQKHYFPTLSPDPSSLSWMAPLPSDPTASAYSPSATSLNPSELRFDFKGRLLPPNLSHQIPSHLGLHHHGAAPEAAGYTIRELAHMSRSAMAPQRCVAFQTVGRILYRLGKGYFGEEGGELYEGLWKCIEEGRILDTMMAEAGREGGEGGNKSAWAVATEALWNWRMGGGKRWKAG